MKLTTLKCPNCSGNIHLDTMADTCFCPYCGAQIHIDDEIQRVEVSYRDEAKIRELEYEEAERKRFREDFERRSKERTTAAHIMRHKKIKYWIIIFSLYALLTLLCILALVLHLPGSVTVFLIGVGILGIFIATCFHPKSAEDYVRYKSPWAMAFLNNFIIFMLFILIYYGVASAIIPATPESSIINTSFSSQTTLETFSSGKYKRPISWTEFAHIDHAVFKPDTNSSVTIQIYNLNTYYSSEGMKLERAIDWLNEFPNTYKVELKTENVHDSLLGIATGTIYEDSMEHELLAYILPIGDQNAFVEVITFRNGENDPYLNDEEALIMSVVY